MARRLIPVLAVAVLMAVATLPLTVQPVAAGSYPVHLEAGPQTAIVLERTTPVDPPAKSILARR